MPYMEVLSFLMEPDLKGEYRDDWVLEGVIALTETEYIAY